MLNSRQKAIKMIYMGSEKEMSEWRMLTQYKRDVVSAMPPIPASAFSTVSAILS